MVHYPITKKGEDATIARQSGSMAELANASVVHPRDPGSNLCVDKICENPDESENKGTQNFAPGGIHQKEAIVLLLYCLNTIGFILTQNELLFIKKKLS